MDAQGFVEARGSWAFGVDGTPYTIVERFRPEIEVDLAENVVLGTTVEAALTEGRYVPDELAVTFENSDAAPMLAAAGCVWPTRTNTWFHIDRASDVFRVDRLYVDVYRPKYDLRVGRQALQWGSAMLVNPSDPFPEVLFTEPWRPRAGVNAARITVPIGERSNQVQIVAATDDALRYGRVASRATVNVKGTDVSLVGAFRGDDVSGTIGADVKGTWGVGFWAEGVAHVGDDLDGDDAIDPPWEEIAVGVDYSFAVGEMLIVGAQYYRNGAGATDTDDYALGARTSTGIEGPDCASPEVEAALAGSAPDPFAPFFLGQDYAMLQITERATADVAVSAVVLQNLRDGTGIGVPVLTVHPTGALEIGATAQIPYRAWGRTGEFKPAPPDLVIDIGQGLGGDLEVDVNGMVPEATVSLWTKANF